MSLRIKGTNSTPQIIAEPRNGLFSISGVSHPENSESFFHSFIESVDKYASNPLEKTVLSYMLEYFHTSTAVIIRDTLRIFKEKNVSGLEVMWYYEADDEVMKDSGEDFKLLFPELNILMIEVANLEDVIEEC